MKKLQIRTTNGWAFVFCRDTLHNRVIITSDKAKALPHRACWAQNDLAYFKRYFSSENFRIAENLDE